MNTFKITLFGSNDITENCGTKALMLSELAKRGVYVPVFYGIGVEDFIRFYQGFNSKSLSDWRGELFLSKKLPEGKYMVRSSVVPKDKENSDFGSVISGAFDSYIADSSVEVPKKILEVWNSFFSEKAKEQCALFLEDDSILGMGVLIQKYIEPVISGVLHSDKNRCNINWTKGHLAEIVSGKIRGNIITCYQNEKKETILRGVEANILEIMDCGYESVFIELEQLGRKIKQELGYEIEMEWLYDGKRIWVVQCQKLIGEVVL